MDTERRDSGGEPTPGKTAGFPGRVLAIIRARPTLIALAYAAFAMLWIFFSDREMGLLVADSRQLVEWSVYKGLAFVVVTAVLLWLLIRGLYGKMEADFQALQAHRAEIERVKRLYAALCQVNQAIVQSGSRAALFEKVCQALVERARFRLAWIALPEAETLRLRVAAQFGDDSGYVQGLELFSDERPGGMGPTGRAFREARPVICNDFMNEPLLKNWHEQALRLGIRASAAIPILIGDDVAGTLNVYAAETGFFQEEEVALLKEAAVEISFALENLAREEGRRAALASAESERRFSESMIDSMPGVLYFFDQGGGFLRWNRSFEAASGFSHREIEGMSPLDFFAPADRARVQQSIGEAFEHGESFLEAPLRSRDGRLTNYFFTGRSVEYENRACLVGVGIDISDRKSAEEEIRRLAEQLQNTLESITDGFFTVDSDWKITYVNTEAGELFPHPREDPRGLDLWEAFPAMTGGTFERELRRAASENATVTFQEYFRALAKWFEVRVYPSAQGLVVYCRDVTAARQWDQALRLSEERFRELAEAVQEVFWITEPKKSRILYVSPAYEKIWGRSCASLYESPASWAAAIHPGDRERIGQAVEERESAGTYDEEYRILRPDGAVRWIRDRAFPVRSATGEVVRIVGTAEDVTGRRDLEDQFRQAQKMEAIGQLAGGVAHDFNNILAAIQGNTQLALTDTDGSHPATASLLEIRKASLRATALVQQILAFSRHQPMDRRSIDLGPTLREAHSFLRAIIASSVDLVLSIDDGVPPVLADSTQVHQVIANLCTNAWHALEDRPGRIEVKLQVVTLDGSDPRLAELGAGMFACVSVIDTGKGMDTATLERLYEPFFTTKAPGKGTGLGMPVVHGIVKGHGGAITVTSEVGKGTTFKVYFPLANSPASVAPDRAMEPRRGEGQHILYLDDEEPLVFLARRMLVRLGYRVSGFTRSEDAMQAFRADPGAIDLVITDLNMPGTPGMQVAAEMLALRPDLPVVLCSGHITEDIRKQAREIGIREVLYKPNTLEEFAESIHQLASGGH